MPLATKTLKRQALGRLQILFILSTSESSPGGFSDFLRRDSKGAPLASSSPKRSGFGAGTHSCDHIILAEATHRRRHCGSYLRIWVFADKEKGADCSIDPMDPLCLNNLRIVLPAQSQFDLSNQLLPYFTFWAGNMITNRNPTCVCGSRRIMEMRRTRSSRSATSGRPRLRC